MNSPRDRQYVQAVETTIIPWVLGMFILVVIVGNALING